MAEIRISRKSVVFCNIRAAALVTMKIISFCARRFLSPDGCLQSWIYQDFVQEQMVLNDDDGDAKDWELFSLG